MKASTTPDLTDMLTAINTAGTCTCRAFPAMHRADLHDENGQVADIEQVPSANWAQLLHAKCTRCGWRSAQSWFAEDFTRPMAQTYISCHRDRWTGQCFADAVAW